MKAMVPDSFSGSNFLFDARSNASASGPCGTNALCKLMPPGGGNITGMGIFNASLGTKRLELMKELMPNASVIGYLLNPVNRMSEIESKSVVSAGRSLGIGERILNAKSGS